jgi:hypothetical protein
VELINNSEHDVSVVLSMDGLDSFAFREKADDVPSGATLGRWVPKKDSRFVYRWFRSKEAPGAPFKLGDRFPKGPGTTGFLTAQFYRCWKKGAPDRLSDSVEDDPQPGGKPGARARLIPITMADLRDSIPVLYARKAD